ncbi:MAG: YjjG family noncanonical pyrimidine nucleotidase, partial [Flavobacteriaceae bacterium]|nr:YjjG family noncanonical pyrimidine nucleotidase [Flavobacteriaceae bacterium]
MIDFTPKHIYFDLDHTLWDFEKNSALTYALIFEQEGIQLDLERFLSFYKPLNAHYWKLYRNNQIEIEQLRFERLNKTLIAVEVFLNVAQVNKLADLYIKHLSDFNALCAGAKEVLDRLAENFELHIITNGFNDVQFRKLKNSGIQDYFASVTTAEAAQCKKPGKAIFEYALQQAKTSAETTLMIGDNHEADVLGARRLGIEAIW